MVDEYEFGKYFQLKLLTLLVRKPKKFQPIIEPWYFTNPVYVDIARVAKEVYKKYGTKKFRLKSYILRELTREGLSLKRRREVWPSYKKIIKSIFSFPLPDQDFLLEQATKFAKKCRYREALILAEKDLNNGLYESVHRRFEDLRNAPTEGLESGKAYDWKHVPRFDPTKAPHTSWIVERFVPEAGITTIVGASGAFKSTVALLMASAISKGEDFLDQNTSKHRVLYLDNENPPDVLKARNENMKLEMETNKRLRLWSTYGSRPVPRILGGELQEIVKRSAADGKKVVIILDHWSSFLRPGEGGETTGQITPLMQGLKHLCALGATVVILHHTRKYKLDVEYGGADLKAKSDAMHTFVLHDDKLHPDRKIIRVACFLKRHGGIYTFAIRPRIVGGQVVGFESVEDPVKTERKQKRQKLRELIKEHPKLPKHALVQKAMEQGLARDEVREMLKKGIGKFWEVRTGAHGRQYYLLLEG